MEKGLIFNIQKFSVHDGPGIRTTVFMKGCPLDCLWCSNPESKSFTPVLLVRDINCRGCGACVAACPRQAITITRESGRKIDWDKCDQCVCCVSHCLYGSLVQCGTYMTVQEVFDQVMQDEIFYKNSGGGVTVSGGEALSQSGFVSSLLSVCKNAGLHTVLDTAGYAPWKNMAALLEFVDLILFDIKHLDSTAHRHYTGVGNELIIENLKKAAGMKEIWLRIPLIKGITDSIEHITRVAALGRDIGAQKISLLPYHQGGLSKSEQLGIAYRFSEGEAPADEYVLELKDLIEEVGIQATINV